MTALYDNQTFEDDKADTQVMYDPTRDTPSEWNGAYRFYAQPRGGDHYELRRKEEGSGSTSELSRDTYEHRSTCRVLLIVFLILSLIAVVIAAVVLAVLLTKTPSSGTTTEEFQSLVRITQEPYISQYNDTSSPEFRDFQNKFCAELLEEVKKTEPDLADAYECDVLEIRNGSVVVRYRLRLKPSKVPPGASASDFNNRIMATISQAVRNGSIGNFSTDTNIVCGATEVGTFVNSSDCGTPPTTSSSTTVTTTTSTASSTTSSPALNTSTTPLVTNTTTTSAPGMNTSTTTSSTVNTTTTSPVLNISTTTTPTTSVTANTTSSPTTTTTITTSLSTSTTTSLPTVSSIPAFNTSTTTSTISATSTTTPRPAASSTSDLSTSASLSSSVTSTTTSTSSSSFVSTTKTTDGHYEWGIITSGVADIIIDDKSIVAIV
ncbi:hypothetical protein C0Q70_21386 [Pomacea canaliculata]|uniref:SEA domain-containing protein n=1 Tax=Pomacea canaliculata TaxID=400727 RepID=A0A2T7NCD4_POMCA|nr:hypothetical protein C0Q70_21386 [Pomacea canaliculata]